MIYFDDIESVEYIESDDVYDITNLDECYDSEGNFIVEDIIVHNCIPEYVERRDDEKEKWREIEHEDMLDIVGDTFGIIVYQEQLTATWRKMARFSAPEAEKARKAIAKKWTHMLKDIKHKWVENAKDKYGSAEAAEKVWDERLEPFGRYAFNRSHSCAYIVIAYWCAWLKCYFAPEWWASVMSECHSNRIPRYMNTARLEGIEFDIIDVERPNATFSVSKELKVTPGISSIKKIGMKKAKQMEALGEREYTDIDDFISVFGKDKTVMERLIKLGSFRKYHDNRRATWMWYQYKYCTDKKSREIKKDIKKQLVSHWSEQDIKKEINRQIKEYKSQYPNRKKIPAKITNWQPTPDDTRENVMALFEEDYKLSEILEFEKEYLGYFINNPMDIYLTDGYTIEHAKSHSVMEVVIEDVEHRKTRFGQPFVKLTVIDGMQSVTVMVWNDMMHRIQHLLNPGVGIKLYADYDDDRGNFAVGDRMPIPLEKSNAQ